MDRLDIGTDQILIRLLNQRGSPTTGDFAKFRKDILSSLAVFLHDRFYAADPVDFLKNLQRIGLKTNKFTEQLKNISSPVLNAISIKDDEMLAAQGGTIEPLFERISADLIILSDHIAALVREESAQGRLVDRPSVNLVRGFADIYREVSGKEPTYGNSSYDIGEATTEFGRFVDETMSALGEAIRLNPDESIRKMRETALKPSPEAVVRLVCSGAETPQKKS